MKIFRDIYDRLNSTFILLLLVLILPGIFTIGCGKKGPPEMIERSQEKLKPVENLEYQVNGNIVQLTWKSNYTKPVEGFEIYIAKQNIEKCQGCPQVFVKTDFVKSGVNEYKKELVKGHRYFIKIITSGIDDIKSSDSETIKVEFP